MKLLMTLIPILALSMSAFATDVNEHLIFDWTPQAPATANAPLEKQDFYDRVNGLVPSAIYNVTQDKTLDDGTVCTAQPMQIVTDESVESPVRRTTMNVPFLRVPQPEYRDTANKLYFANHKIAFPKESVKPVREMTIFLRFRWRGKVGGADRTDVFGYDYSWNDKTGINLSIDSAKRPAIAFGDENPAAVGDLWMEENIWMELAYTIKEVTNEQGQVEHQLGAFLCRKDKNAGQIVSASKTVTGKTLLYHSADSRRSYLSVQDNTTFQPKGTYYRNFRGDVQRLAVYDKAFTAEEVGQIMADDVADFSVGVPNRSAAEFFDAETVSDFDCATMPWRKMRANLTETNPKLTLNVDLPETTVGNARLLRFGVVGDGNRSAGNAFLRVSVNGKKVGYVKVEQTNALYHVCLPAALMGKHIVKVGDAYPLALAFERVGNWSGDMAIDHVWLGGTWQVGIYDKNNAEFGGTSPSTLYGYCVSANSSSLCAGSIYGNNGDSSYNPLRIHFMVPGVVAESFETTLLLRLKEGTKWKLRLNGVDYFSDYWEGGYKVSDICSIPFPAGTLRAGQNEVDIVVPSVSAWTKPDAFSLKLTEQYPCSLWPHPYDGLILLFR